jgi:hypothetical protein
MTHLALDGPYNGTYLDELTALNSGYSLTLWPTGEEVWVHSTSAHLTAVEDDTPYESPEAIIIEAVMDAEIR